MRIHIHGDATGQRVAFQAALERQCAQLDIDLDLTVGGDPPAVTVVFPAAGTDWTDADADLHAALALAAHAVLPVIGTADDAQRLPHALRRFNAFQTGLWGTNWQEGLVDDVLSHAWLHRRERRVFVSYKRKDSEFVANQIYEALTRRGYVTFLDDVSIGKGLDFQGELKWWLNDADVLLVLLSPNFEQSRWCMEEIAFAQSRSVALVALEWPDSAYAGKPFADGSSAPTRPVLQDAVNDDQRLRLSDTDGGDSDFAGDAAAPLCTRELTTDALHRVMAMCARQRSLAIWQRLEDLIPFAEEMLRPVGLERARRAGDFSFQDADGTSHFVRVLPHRPDARALRDIFQASGNETVVGCFYSECDPGDARAESLRWLADRTHEDGRTTRRTRIWPYIGDKQLP